MTLASMVATEPLNCRPSTKFDSDIEFPHSWIIRRRRGLVGTRQTSSHCSTGWQTIPCSVTLPALPSYNTLFTDLDHDLPARFPVAWVGSVDSVGAEAVLSWWLNYLLWTQGVRWLSLG